MNEDAQEKLNLNYWIIERQANNEADNRYWVADKFNVFLGEWDLDVRNATVYSDIIEATTAASQHTGVAYEFGVSAMAIQLSLSADEANGLLEDIETMDVA